MTRQRTSFPLLPNPALPTNPETIRPEDFMLLILLAIWTVDPSQLNQAGLGGHICNHGTAISEAPILDCQDFTFLEFFSGLGNLHRVFRVCGRFKAARFDLIDAPANYKGSNYMDINDTSGFM